ncbi:MAG: ThuA domain-containing protein [Bacteroidota bacterium]
MLRLALATVLLAGCSDADSPGASPDEPARVLVFSKTEGFRHASIADGIAALREIGADRGFEMDPTEDSLAFTASGLEAYAAVVFLNTTGDVLGPEAEQALEAYVEGGRGWVGVHAAADTEYDWPWYGRLVGAYFADHPAIQEATVTVAEADHPATRGLPSTWVRTDEWYNFRAPPQDVTVLLRLDESTYEGGSMGDDHPIAWSHTMGQGRAFYTALGHTPASYTEAAFRDHLGGGVCWAARLACPWAPLRRRRARRAPGRRPPPRCRRGCR